MMVLGVTAAVMQWPLVMWRRSGVRLKALGEHGSKRIEEDGVRSGIRLRVDMCPAIGKSVLAEGDEGRRVWQSRGRVGR